MRLTYQEKICKNKILGKLESVVQSVPLEY